MTFRNLTILAAFCLFGISGCAPSLSPADRAALERAGFEMDRQLTPAGRFAATAALIYEEEGAFPTTRFELLGSPQAAATGLRVMNLSVLEIEATDDAFSAEFILLPTQEDPTDRMGSLVIRPADQPGEYHADIELLRRDDLDHTGRMLPLAREGQVEVHRLRGRFHVDIETVRDQVAATQAGDMPLHDEAYRITFTPFPPGTTGFPAELQEGFVVTIGE